VSKLKQFFDLNFHDRWLFLHAFISLPIIEIGIRVFGLKKAMRFLATKKTAKRKPNTSPNEPLAETALHEAALIRTAARNVPLPARCVARTLYQWRRLLKQGCETTVCIGMEQADDTGFHAHAWLEHEGTVLNDDPAAISSFQTVRLARDLDSDQNRVIER